MVVKIGTCPKCRLRVIPKADGTCPNCHAVIARPLAATSSDRLTAEPRPKAATGVRTRKEPARGESRPRRHKPFPLGFILIEALKTAYTERELWLPGVILYSLNLASILVLSRSSNPVSWFSLTPGNEVRDIFAPDSLPLLLTLRALMLLSMLVLSFGLIMTTRGVRQVYERNTPLALGTLLVESKRYFWRWVLLYITLSFMIGLAMLPALGLVAWLIALRGLTSPINILLWVVIIPGFLILSTLLQYSTAALTLEDRSVNASIRRGWQVFRRNVWISLLLALLLDVPLLLLFSLLTSSVPLLTTRLLALPGSGADPGTWVLTTSLAVGAALLFIAVQAFWWIFRITTWVFTWFGLTGTPSKRSLPGFPNA